MVKDSRTLISRKLAFALAILLGIVIGVGVALILIPGHSKTSTTSASKKKHTRGSQRPHRRPVKLPLGLGTIDSFAPLPVFAPNSVWSAPVNAQTRIDPSSSALVKRLVDMVDVEEQRHYGPAINSSAWSVPVYSVPANQPRVPVIIDDHWSKTLQAALSAGAPIPPNALPAAGSDSTLVVWQPSTDTLWEFWHAYKGSDGWHVKWGGVMHNVSQNPGYFTGKEQPWGATATSLASTGGLITPKELRDGVINHALAMAIPQVRRREWTWPAQRTDGGDRTPDAIPEGAHFRLDPNLNLDALHLPRITLILARAAQRYGIIVRDKSSNVTLYAQDPSPTGINPYPILYGNQLPSQFLASFPWAHLQLLPMTLYTLKTRKVERTTQDAP